MDKVSSDQASGKDTQRPASDALLSHLSPLRRGDISLTGDHTWRQSRHTERGKLRLLRPLTDS